MASYVAPVPYLKLALFSRLLAHHYFAVIAIMESTTYWHQTFISYKDFLENICITFAPEWQRAYVAKIKIYSKHLFLN